MGAARRRVRLPSLQERGQVLSDEESEDIYGRGKPKSITPRQELKGETEEYHTKDKRKTTENIHFIIRLRSLLAALGRLVLRRGAVHGTHSGSFANLVE
jgi:hypothetical protein